MKFCSLLLVTAFLFASCKEKELVVSNCQFPFAVPTVSISKTMTGPAEQAYDLEKVKCISAYTRTLTEFPKAVYPKEAYVALSAEEVKKQGLTEVETAFYDLQKSFFKNRNITVEFTNNEVGFSAEYNERKVAVEVKAVKRILADTSFKAPMDVLKYIMAHELGHFIHELASREPISAKPGYTLHGNVSIYRIQNANSATIPTGEQIELVENFQPHYLNSHAEVDLFATSTLADYNFNGWADVYKFFDQMIKEGGELPGGIDFKGRKNVVQKVVAAKRK